jgi:predicted RND superfamily exporter protein
MGHFGLYPIEYSVPSTGPGGISEPEYLQNLESFADYLRDQPNVTHVYALSDIMKRLNRNMHGDDAAWHRIPGDRELSAQYLLLYELSLPYGLDLNDRINIDKSATRVTATLTRTSTTETKAFFNSVAEWQQANWPAYMHTEPTSAAVMFTYISERNMENMVTGTIVAILAIALIMVFALQSLRLGLLSLVPNGLPILTTFGAWALLVGTVGFSVATVASISLGIIVDDTVHFLSKYVRARNERRLSIEDSIRYAFHNVGIAIVVNTIILAAGFFVMTTSAFKMNVDLGLMTMLAIGFALILDFLLLPALLLLGKRQSEASKTPEAALPAPAAATAN